MRIIGINAKQGKRPARRMLNPKMQVHTMLYNQTGIHDVR